MRTVPVKEILVSLALVGCGGASEPAAPGGPLGGGPPPPTPEVRFHYAGPATVVKNGVTETGRVEFVAFEAPASSQLTLTSTTLGGTHRFAGGTLNFVDASAPGVGTYTSADAAPGTVFWAEDGGDIYDSTHGGGLGALVIGEATAAAVHGSLTFSVKFAGTTVATF